MDWSSVLIGAIVSILISGIYGVHTYKKCTKKIDKIFDDALDDFKKGF